MDRTINNQKRFKQQLLFEGTERGNICFTDVDFIQEIDNHSFIIGECKVKNNPLTQGQKWIIERLCDKPNWTRFVGVVVEHDVPTDRDVRLTDTIVREVYKGNKIWDNVLDKKKTFKDFYDHLCKKWDIQKLNEIR